MIDVTPGEARKNGIAHIGAQPIALAAVALAVLLAGGGTVALWRASTGSYPETDRAIAIRQIQTRATEATEQLADKTKAIGVTQQTANNAGVPGTPQTFSFNLQTGLEK